MAVALAGGRGNGEIVFNGYRVSVGKKKFWRKIMILMVAGHCEYTVPQNHTLKND